MSAKELMETFKNKTSEEITNYLYKRLEASHVLMPRGIQENASGQDQDTTELSSIISSVNAEATPEYTADSEPKFARALDAPEDLDPPMLLRLLFASAGLRECMGFLGCCPVMEYMATVARAAPPKAVCGRMLNDEQAYRCLDCQHDDSSIFCIDCFEPAKHVGHKYFITRANGVCDCGDANALNPAGFCEHHKGVDPDEDLRRYFPTTYMRTTRAVLRALCMYAAAHVADHASDDALAVFCVLYVLVRSLGYGFASVLGDALTEPFDATPRDPRCALYAGMLAEYKDSPYALSLLWDVVFYNPLVPIRTRKYANKMLFEMISIPDFKQKFTVVFVSLYRVMVLHRARLFPVTKKKKENAHHKNKEGEEEEEEEYEEEYVEGESDEDEDEDEDDDDNGIRQFSVQLISSKGSCGKALEDLKFFKTIFDVLYEVLSKCKLEGAPYIDPDKLNSSTISVLCTSCYDTRYGLQQVSGTGVDTFYRSPTTRGTLTSMYRALSLLQGACPNKLITKGFASRKANVNSVLQAELYWATAQDDVVNGFRKLTPPEKVNILGWVLAEMWHQMVDVHPSYLKNRRLVPIAAEPVGKLCPVVIYDITSEAASFVDPLNTLTTRLIMAALQDLDDMAPVFQEAAADIADASFSSSGESGEHSTDMTFAQGLLEAPLRSLACSGQIEAMHWVRNGEVLHLVEKLVRRSPTFGDAFGLNDFRTLQLCAALLPRDLFVLTVLDRFGVAGGPRRHPALISVVSPGVVYSAIELLLLVALDTTCLPRADPAAATRRTMVHFLACTPSFTYQSGLDMCGPTCEEHYDAVLKDIAVCSNGHYRLADHLWDTEVSPYFFYGDSDIMGAIREGYELHLKRNKRPMQALPCPRAPEAPAAHPLFARLPQVLASRALHVLIAQALCGAKFREDDDDREPSAQVFVQPCLHVLYLCLTSEAVCPRDEVDAVVVKEALRSVNGTCTVAVLCGIYANYSENKALTAAILRFLTARSPECRAVAEVAFAALGVKNFSFDASTDSSSSSPSATSPPSSSCEPDTKEKARAAERKKCQANVLSKLRAKQNAFIEKQAKLMKNSEGDDKDEDTPAHSSTNVKEEKEEEDGCDSDSNVCVFCHGHEGTLYWIGYAQTSDLLCRVDEVSKDALTLSNSNEDVPLRGRGNNVLDFLGRGLRSGTYVQRCKHRAHKECFERYRVADNFRSVGAIDRETLQYSCPVCFCLSNVLIPPPTTTISDTDSDNNDDDLSFFIPLCYAENREANIYPDQELFYVVCRSLAYTAASYELAARSTGPIAAYLTPERRGILAALLAKARSTLPLLEDPSTKHPHSCCSPREPLSPG